MRKCLILLIAISFIGGCIKAPQYRPVPMLTMPEIKQPDPVKILKSELELPKFEKLPNPKFIYLDKKDSCWVETDSPSGIAVKAYDYKNSKLITRAFSERKVYKDLLLNYDKELTDIAQHWLDDKTKDSLILLKRDLQLELDVQYIQYLLIVLHNAKEDTRYYKQSAKLETLISKAASILLAISVGVGFAK